jgi:hypothetical protein
VCSKLVDENTIEHYRLSQCVRTQIHTEEVERKQNFFQRTYYSNFPNVNYTLQRFALYKLKCLTSKTQPQYKLQKPVGCVNVNRIFHNRMRYTQPKSGYFTAGLYREILMTGDSLIKYSSELINLS